MQELAQGRKAYERVVGFQRAQGPFSFAFLLIFCSTGGIWKGFDLGGWKLALVAGVFWLSVSAISIYQYRQQRRRAKAAITFLARLKSTYGEGVYATIEKQPSSLFYRLFQRRFPPFNQRAVRLP